MDAGVRPRGAPDASLNDLALERLFAHGQLPQQQRHANRHRQLQRQKWAIFPPPAPAPEVIAEGESVPFLRNPKLTDEGHDVRGFWLLHHAAAFGNVRKVCCGNDLLSCMMFLSVCSVCIHTPMGMEVRGRLSAAFSHGDGFGKGAGEVRLL